MQHSLSQKQTFANMFPNEFVIYIYIYSYMPDPCNSCNCGLGELPTCSQTVCPNAGGYPTRCIGCVD